MHQLMGFPWEGKKNSPAGTGPFKKPVDIEFRGLVSILHTIGILDEIKF